MQWLKLICIAVEQHLHIAEMGEESFPAAIDVMSTVPKVVANGTVEAGTLISFAGPAHWQRMSPSIKVADVVLTGEDSTSTTVSLYVNGDRFQTVGSEVLVPAWLAKPASPSKPANFELGFVFESVDLSHIKMPDQEPVLASLSIARPRLAACKEVAAGTEFTYVPPADFFSSGSARAQAATNS
jgi:hypothetical protein